MRLSQVEALTLTFFADNFDDYEEVKALGDGVDKPKKFRKLQG